MRRGAAYDHLVPPLLLGSPPVATAASEDALQVFRAFSAAHALVIVAFVVCSAIVLGVAERMLRLDAAGSTREAAFARRLGAIGLIVWVIINGYGFLPHVFEWRLALPLHVCDIAALVGPLVLYLRRPRPWMRAVLYFAGIGLCTQAFITPTLREGPANPQFWCFWTGHFLILIAALYDLLIRRWRPTWRHWRIAMALSLGYLFVLFPLDFLFNWNYGYLGQAPQPGTMLEVLGPWPQRVPIIVALVALAYTLMMLPWVLAARGWPAVTRRSAPAP